MSYEDTIIRPLVLKATGFNADHHSPFCDFVKDAGGDFDQEKYVIVNWATNIYSWLGVYFVCVCIFTDKKAQVHPWKL